MILATATETPSRRRPSLVRRGLIAIVLSAIANAVLLGIAQAVRIAPDFRPLAWPPVLFLTVVGAVGAVAVYWAIARWSDDPDRTFTLVASVVLVLSFVPDLFLLFADENATVFGVVVLMAMHVAVAAVCIGVLTRG